MTQASSPASPLATTARAQFAPTTASRRVFASLVTGIAVAGIVHLVVVLAFFLANGATSEILIAVNQFFLLSSLSVFVLTSVATALGALRNVWVAVGVGIVAGAIGALGGTVLGLVPSGTTWTTEVLLVLVGSLAGTNLLMVVATAIAYPTIGRRVWRALVGQTSTNRSGRMLALVRPPSSRMQDGELTHLERVPIDVELADEQWEGYVAALEANGFTAIEVTAADELPDSVFIEDTMVVFGDTAVVASPGADSRRGEIAAVGAAARELGLRVRGIDLPGTLDGGDVLKIGTTVYVGRGGRTNAEGIRQLRTIVAPLGYSVVAVPVTKALHLKSAVTALPGGTVIGHPSLVDAPELFARFLAVPEKEGAAVVVLADDAVLMSSAAPESAALIADLGYRVVTVDVSEFEKLEGCVTCLSVRIR